MLSIPKHVWVGGDWLPRPALMMAISLAMLSCSDCLLLNILSVHTSGGVCAAHTASQFC